MRALVLGATGQLGHAVAARLAASGWTVFAAARGHRPLAGDLVGSRGITRLDADGRTVTELIAETGRPVDLVFDPTAYDAEDAAALREAAGRFGHLVAVSSASVYADPAGRTLDEASLHGFPDFPDPIGEDCATVAPADATYSTRKVAMENLLRDAKVPTTILRPCAIHGAYARHPREWWLVKRAMDGRAAIPVAFLAQSRFHTTSARGIADLVELCAGRPGSRILNVADATAPTVADIADAVSSAIGRPVPLFPFDGPPAGHVGSTPWSTAGPFIVDCAAAHALGWQPATYAEDVRDICAWMLDISERGDWRAHFTHFLGYGYEPFDYTAEDAFMLTRR